MWLQKYKELYKELKGISQQQLLSCQARVS